MMAVRKYQHTQIRWLPADFFQNRREMRNAGYAFEVIENEFSLRRIDEIGPRAQAAVVNRHLPDAIVNFRYFALHCVSCQSGGAALSILNRDSNKTQMEQKVNLKGIACFYQEQAREQRQQLRPRQNGRQWQRQQQFWGQGDGLSAPAPSGLLFYRDPCAASGTVAKRMAQI